MSLISKYKKLSAYHKMIIKVLWYIMLTILVIAMSPTDMSADTSKHSWLFWSLLMPISVLILVGIVFIWYDTIKSGMKKKYWIATYSTLLSCLLIVFMINIVYNDIFPHIKIYFMDILE